MSLPDRDDQILILHNPRCSKSRQGLALLEEVGAKFTPRRYLDDPLSLEELEELARRIGRPVIEWTRTKEAEFRDAGLTKGSPDGEILRAMAEHPRLIERPIVIRGARAVLGRPPEALRTLL